MMKPATPLPWREWHGDLVAEGDEATDFDDYVIAGFGVSRGGRSSVYCPIRFHKPDGQQNAAYIVHACNTFPALVEALEALEGRFEQAANWRHNAQEWANEEGWVEGMTLLDWFLSDARAALSLAKGEAA